MRKRRHANMPSKKRRLVQLEGEKKKTAKTPSSSFFSGNEQLKIMILYIPILLLLFMHLSGISKNTNKQKTRKKNVYDGDRKLRFIDRQTTGDKLNETGRQTCKLQNGQVDNTNI